MSPVSASQKTALRTEALEILRRLSIPELWDQVVKQLFFSRGWKPLYEDFEAREISLGAEGLGEAWAIVVHLEVPEQDAPSPLVDRISTAAQAALADQYRNIIGDLHPRVPPLRYHWILPQVMPDKIKEEVRERIGQDFSDRVSVWDLDTLSQKLVDMGGLRTSSPLQILYAKHQAAEHIQAKNEREPERRDIQGVFAAHWFYRAFRLYLQQGKDGRDRALESLDEGLAALAQDPWRSLHPHRVLRHVFDTWSTLLRRSPDLFETPVQSLDQLPERDITAALDFLKPGHPRLDWLLVDFDSMFRQLDILAEKYVDTPAGLSTLQICRLLLRAGFPPIEPGIDKRLKRAFNDLGNENGESIDESCSLCTGTAVSMFSLARRRQDVETAVGWLTGDEVRECRFSTIDSMPAEIAKDEHALHYAASVLQGFLDFEGGQSKNRLEPVLEVFFQKTDSDDRDFFREWIRHANIERFEVYRYILAAFLHYHLMGLALPASWEEMLRQAVLALIHALNKEGRELKKIYLFYPARMNLSSLALGLLLDGGAEVEELARQVTGYLRRRPEASGKRRGQLWDSNVDRNVVLLDSYLDYWETLFALEERGKSILGLLPDEAPPPPQSDL